MGRWLLPSVSCAIDALPFVGWPSLHGATVPNALLSECRTAFQEGAAASAVAAVVAAAGGAVDSAVRGPAGTFSRPTKGQEVQAGRSAASRAREGWSAPPKALVHSAVVP